MSPVDEQRSRKPVFIDGWNFRDNVITYSNRGKTNIMNYDGKKPNASSEML